MGQLTFPSPSRVSTDRERRIDDGTLSKFGERNKIEDSHIKITVAMPPRRETAKFVARFVPWACLTMFGGWPRRMIGWVAGVATYQQISVHYGQAWTR